jgi:hypothetical protein
MAAIESGREDIGPPDTWHGQNSRRFHRMLTVASWNVVSYSPPVLKLTHRESQILAGLLTCLLLIWAVKAWDSRVFQTTEVEPVVSQPHDAVRSL